MPVIINTHPKDGVGKTASSINIVGEMKSDTVDLDTHTGLFTILRLRPEGKEVPVKVPRTVDKLIETMTPCKNSDKTLLIDCGRFSSDLIYTAIAFADCVIVPSKDSPTECIGLMHFDRVLDEINSIMGADITAHLYLCETSPNKKKLPKLGTILPSFRHLKLMESRVSARTESEDAIETRMGITESVHGRHSAGGKEVTALIGEVNRLIESDKQ